MSTKDTAGDQLVASIRKTKTRAVTSSKKSVTKVAVKQTTPTAAKKASPITKKTTPVAKKTAPVAKKPVQADSDKAKQVDAFQGGRRVWPD